MASEQRQFCRDRRRSQTPGGHPVRKPRRIVMRLIDSQHRNPSEFFVLERPKRYPRVGLQQCMESRPPLKMELLAHPSPCTYSIPFTSLTTRGVVRQPLNPRYPRDALPYPTKEVWTHELADRGAFPSPCSYSLPRHTGSSPPHKPAAPSFTMGTRIFTSLARKAAGNEPAPNSYSREQAAESTLPHHPAFSIVPPRATGREAHTPGPAHYYPLYTANQHRSPSFSIRSRTSGLRT